MPRIREPKYCLHKTSGQAYVRLDGRMIYLGIHGSEESHAEYVRLKAEWLLSGRRTLPPASETTVVELIHAYLTLHVDGYFRKPSGRPTREAGNIRVAMRTLRRLYGHTRACQFGPLALKAVRDDLIEANLSRTYINDHVGRIKRLFKWGVANELVPPATYQSLTAVDGLRRGRSAARETAPVKPVPDAWVDAIECHVSRQIWAMVQLQRLTGMRSGEVCLMRGADIETEGDVWIYRPAEHKTEHHACDRIVPMGPQAQQIVRAFLRPDTHAYLFDPRDAVAERHAAARTHRRPNQQSKRPKTPRRITDRYTPDSYRRAITRACEKADVPRWHPHQLRHAAGTRVRKNFGLEAAQVHLGHASASVTQVYAEKNLDLAREVARRIG